jgi:hypothetical protein
MEETVTQPIIKTGHDYLREMCSFEADHACYASIPRHNPMTNRVEYIMHQLTAMNIPFEQDIFDCYDVKKTNGKFNYININVLFKGTDQTTTTVFLAHHDVNKKSSENAQDNTASVCNLLDLCGKLKTMELLHNVLICFTDAEEVVDYKCSGAAKLAHDINTEKYGTVLQVTNLELTGLGKNVWVSAYGKNELLKKCVELGGVFKPTPYSDTFSLFVNGVTNTVCIGILPDHEIHQQDMNKIATWRLCHQEADTFDKCSKEDMDNFVEKILIALI